MHEQPQPSFDDYQKIVDEIFATLLINPRAELAEEILRFTDVMGEEETLDDFTDEELKILLQKAAQQVVASPELTERIAQMYGKK